jgi:hypothetical protein
MTSLIVDGIEYVPWVVTDEATFEGFVKKYYSKIFGEKSIFFEKRKLTSWAGISSIPDGFVVSFQEKKWFIVEVEISSHDPQKHIAPQINNFRSFVNSETNRISLVREFDRFIKEDAILHARVKQWVENAEIHACLSDIIFGYPKTVIIIDSKSERLVEATDVYRPLIVEFKIFERIGIGTKVHAVLFEPVYSYAKPPAEGIQVIGEPPRELPPNTEARTDGVMEVTLNGPGARKHGYLPFSRKDRRFFPGYNIPFVLETDIGEIRTKVTGTRKANPQAGDPDDGAYVSSNLKPWYDKHPSVDAGAKLRFECTEPYKRYRLSVV